MRLTTLLYAGTVILAAPGVFAQEKPARGAVTLQPVTIVGRIQRPIATVDVNRVVPKLGVAELKPPFFEAIAPATQAEPF